MDAGYKIDATQETREPNGQYERRSVSLEINSVGALTSYAMEYCWYSEPARAPASAAN